MRIPLCLLALMCAAAAATPAVCPTTSPASGSCTVGVSAPTTAAANSVIAANSGSTGGSLSLTSPPSAASVSAGNVCYRLCESAPQSSTAPCVSAPPTCALTRHASSHIHSGVLRLRCGHVQLRHRPGQHHLPRRRHHLSLFLRALHRLRHPAERVSGRPERVHCNHEQQRLQRRAKQRSGSQRHRGGSAGVHCRRGLCRGAVKGDFSNRNRGR